jgi:hypothetical protein
MSSMHSAIFNHAICICIVMGEDEYKQILYTWWGVRVSVRESNVYKERECVKCISSLLYSIFHILFAYSVEDEWIMLQ